MISVFNNVVVRIVYLGGGWEHGKGDGILRTWSPVPQGIVSQSVGD